jgi:ribosomal protein L29
MKRNDFKKLASLDTAELLKKLDETMKAAAIARLEKKVGKLTNTKLASTLAKDIARIKTVLTEKGMKA